MSVVPVIEIATRESYLEAVEQVREAALSYYNSDTTVMDDATYDALVRGIAAAETAHPGWKIAESPTENVGAEVVAPDKAVAHTVPMLSLDNLFDALQVEDWVGSRTKLLGRAPSAYVVEAKYDGVACSVLYENGKLMRLASRGDGTTGENMTYAAARVKNLPAQLTEAFTGEIRGEIMFSASDFATANEARIATGKAAYVNPRNAASGAIRAETLHYPVSLTFFPYGLVGGRGIPTHSGSLERISELGILAPDAVKPARCKNAAEINAAIIAIETAREELPFEIDGAVIKVDSIEEQEELGLASRAPRWGTAYKYPVVEAWTIMRNVVWSVGRTGRITPTAEFDPVFIAGSEINFASLHNASDLTAKGLAELPSYVRVCKAKEIIPRVAGRVPGKLTGEEAPLKFPETCPQCGGGIDKSEKIWRCLLERGCSALAGARYACSRDCVDVEGLGEQVLADLVKRGVITDVADIFTLTFEDLVAVPRLGESNSRKILAQIEKAKSQPLSRVFCALGVRMTGRSLSRRIAKVFGTMDALLSASVEQLAEVDGVGPIRAAKIKEELVELAPVIEKMKTAGVNMIEPDLRVKGPGGGALAGRIVVVSGSVPGMSRNEANEAVERLGGTSTGSVGPKMAVERPEGGTVGILVTAETTTSKAVKAAKLGVEIMEPAAFANLVASAS